MRRSILLLSLVLMMVPLTSLGQPGGEHQRHRSALAALGAADPAGQALALSEELELTSEQIAALEAVQSRLQTVNEPLLAQLRETLPEDAEESRAERQRGASERRRGGPRGRMTERREQMAAVRPLMQQLRENRQEAANEVATVLTPEQQAIVDARRDEQRQTMRQRMREQR